MTHEALPLLSGLARAEHGLLVPEHGPCILARPVGETPTARFSLMIFTHASAWVGRTARALARALLRASEVRG